jgi:hypothetical protein
VFRRISIILLNHNGAEDTIACLQSLQMVESSTPALERWNMQILMKRTLVRNRLEKTHSSAAVCMWLIPKKVFEKVGFINEEYFMYVEDLEFAQRVLKAGFRLTVLTLVSIVVSGVALVEYYQQHNRFAGIVPASFIAIQKLQSGIIRDESYRVWSTFTNPIALNYCSTVIPLLAWFAFNHRGWRCWIGHFSMFALLITLYLTGSRAGLFVLIFISTGFLVIKYLPGLIKRTKTYLKIPLLNMAIVVTFIIVTGAWFGGKNLVQGRCPEEIGSSAVRMYQLERGMPLIIAQPVTGYGPGDSAVVLGLAALTVDNYYLVLALESGLTEVALFVLMLLYFLRLSWNLEKNLPKPLSGLATAIFWSIAGNSVFMLVLSLEQVIPLLFILFAMLITLHRYT